MLREVIRPKWQSLNSNTVYSTAHPHPLWNSWGKQRKRQVCFPSSLEIRIRDPPLSKHIIHRPLSLKHLVL